MSSKNNTVLKYDRCFYFYCLLGVHVVINTINLPILPCRLAEYAKECYSTNKVRASARAARRVANQIIVFWRCLCLHVA